MDTRNTRSRGSAFGHLRHAIFGAVRGVVLAGLAFAALGAIGTEAVGAYLAQGVPTTGTHIAAVALALILGYAAALTVAFRALLGGIIHGMEWVVGEIEHLAGGVVRDAESVLHLPGGERGGRAGTTTATRGAGGRSSGGLTGGVVGGVPDGTVRTSAVALLPPSATLNDLDDPQA
jgi:hypothetical protein